MTEERQNPASPHELTLDPKTIDVLIANIIPTSKYFESRFDNLQYQVNEIKEDIKNLEVRMDKRFEQVDKRFEQVDKRFEQVDKRFEQVDKRFEQVDAQFVSMRAEIKDLEVRMDKRFEQVDKRFEQMDSKLDRDFWSPTLSSPTWSSRVGST